ncbi:hypothetical protein C8J56DRAFT_896521 [Mycena floridula]|nr:hypothetical protein C8J56DRAFT_896515 [Mycena floridula]KAJ7580534.1 hypothetical protein C8J56DRAFT_896521 [Mycena floridula]
MTERAPPEKVKNGCSILDELILCASDNLGKPTRHIFNTVVHCRKIHDIVQGIRARNDALPMDYRRITQLKIERQWHVTEAKQGTPGNVPGVRVVASVIKVVYRGSNVPELRTIGRRGEICKRRAKPASSAVGNRDM